MKSTTDPTIRQAVDDLQLAVEEGVFAVETPTLRVGQTAFHHIGIGWGSDKTYITRNWGTEHPYLATELEWKGEPALYGDLQSVQYPQSNDYVVLHGIDNEWHVTGPQMVECEINFDHDGSPIATVEIEWLDVEPL